MTSRQIRQGFIDFFVQKHAHKFVPSSPVVPWDDPTLLFTNAGMNQFKPLFLGQEKRDYTRAANTQKCIRAGGKHNDLDDVGRSRRHHTFFEMLGNWSFGDYFKQGAIEMAWELLTKVWKLDPTRLHVTCFEGDEKNGVPRDTEAAEIWKKVAGLPDDHIHYFGADNFWEMGDTGPCGPCSEIYIDRTPDKSGGKDVNGDDPRVMEIWNLVFIQYNRNPDRSLTVLPAQHVDTGMGLERVTQVIQDKTDNYAIDSFVPLFDALTKLSGFQYKGTFPKTNKPDPAAEAADAQLRHDIAFRVIADHLRCLTFALTDGAEPSNEGRGYVLRRILRRAVRFGRQSLELKDPFLHTLVPVIVDTMGDAFPELKKNPKRVVELVKDEEISFNKTLDRGIALSEQASVAALGRSMASRVRWRFGGCATSWRGDSTEPPEGRRWTLSFIDESGQPKTFGFDGDYSRFIRENALGSPVISADDAFKLHDTYGFPIDLTRIMAEERGMSVDIAGYEKLMEEAKEKARAGGKGGDSPVYALTPAAMDELQKQNVAPTDDSSKFSTEPIEATVRAIWNGSNLDPSADTSEDQEVAILLDRTNFYAEMGGQVGDCGALASASTSATFDVATARAVGGYILHIGRVRSGTIKVGDRVTASLAPSRQDTQKNHTATHLANWALREVLGDGIQQKGSLVDPEKLRFDFSHGKSLSDDEIVKTEKLVNDCVAKRLPVFAETAPQEQALKINGLRAVFGEKYPPQVRVVSIGAKVGDLLSDPAKSDWRQYSIEFCGGTHLANTGEVGPFVITAEESVSKGIRRIVAVTGGKAQQSQRDSKALLDALEDARKAPEQEIPRRNNDLQKQIGESSAALSVKRRVQQGISELQQKYKAWEKQHKSSSAGGGVDVVAAAGKLLDEAPTIAGGKLIVAEIAGATDDQLRSAMDSLKKKQPSIALLLAASDGTKITFLAAVSDDLIARGLKAGDWVRETAKLAGGGGGGRPQMAQAGGKDPAKMNQALDGARAFAMKALG